MATRTISTKLAVEGESQYKAALKNCNNELKLLKSSLAVASSEFKDNANSTQALTAKGELLNQMYAAQEKKLEAMKTVLASAQKAQNAYSDEVEDYKKKLATAQNELDNLKNSTGDTTDEQEKLRKKIAELSAGLEKATAKQQSAKNAVDTYQTSLNYAQRDLNNLNAEIKKNDQYLDEAANSADGCATSIDEFGKEIKGASNGIDTLAGALAAAGLAGTVKEIAEVLIDCTKAAIEFESAITGVYKTVDGTAEQLSAISDGIKEMALRIPATTTELARVAETAGQLGIATEDVLSFTEVMTNLGVATNLSADEAASALAKFANVVKMSPDDYDRLGSTIVALGNNFATTEADIVAMATRLASTGAVVGLSESQIMAVATALSSVGIEAEAGGSAVSKLMKKMETAVQTYDQANGVIKQTGMSLRDLELLADADSKAFKGIAQELGYTSGELKGFMANAKSMEQFSDVAGMTAREFQDAWGSDAVLALDTFLTELNALDESGTSAITVLGDMGLTEVRLSNAVLSMAKSGGILTKTLGVSNQAWEENNALTKEAEQRYGTTESKLTLLKNSANNLKIAIGNQLKPALDGIADAGSKAFQWAAELVEKNPWLVKAITILAASVGVVTGAIVAYVAITKIANIVTETLSTTMGKSPWGAIAIAVGAVVTALTLLVAATNNSKTAADELNESLAETKKAYEESIAGIEEEEQTTLGMISTLQKLTAKEEKTAADKQLILDIVEKLNEALPELNLAYDEQTDSVNYTTEALRKLAIAQYEAAKQQENLNRLNELYVEQYNIADAIKTATEEFKKYEAEYRRLQSIPNHGTREIPQDLYAAQAAYLDAKIELEKLTKSQTENDAEIARLEESYNNYINTLGAAVEEQEKAKAAVENAQESIKNLEAEIATLEESYQSAYEKAYDTLTEQMGLFAELDGSAKKSIDDLIKSLESQIKFMDDYADNIALAMERGVDDGLIKKLSNGSEESAQILAAIVAGSDDKIKELNEKLGSVEEGKEEFSSAVAEMQTNFSAEMDKLEGRMDEAVDALDQAEEAKKAAQNTIQGAIDGVISKETAYKGKYKQLAKMGLQAFENELEIKSPSRKFEQAGKYAVEGNIKGVEEKTPDFEKQYRELAQKGLEAITYEIPSSTSVASPTDQTSAKIIELIGMIRGGSSGGAPVTNNYGPAQDVNVFQVGDEVVTHAVKNRVSAGINTDYEAIRRASGYGD